MSVKQVIFPLTVCLLFIGCVGGSVRSTKTVVIEHPEILDRAYVCNVLHGSPHNAQVYTAAWLREHWGQPTEISRTGAGEAWKYNFGHSWSGLYLFIVIPIPPFALPVGNNSVSFDVRGDRVVSAKRSVARTVGSAFGFSIGPCTPLQFGPFSLSESECSEDHP
jgi:hypothetical protein